MASVSTQLARQEASLEFLKGEVKEIKEEMRGMRNSVRAMLFSLVVTIVGGGFFVLVGDR